MTRKQPYPSPSPPLSAKVVTFGDGYMRAIVTRLNDQEVCVEVWKGQIIDGARSETVTHFICKFDDARAIAIAIAEITQP